MTEKEFIDQAKKMGYSDKFIEETIDRHNRDKFCFRGSACSCHDFGMCGQKLLLLYNACDVPCRFLLPYSKPLAFSFRTESPN